MKPIAAIGFSFSGDQIKENPQASKKKKKKKRILKKKKKKKGEDILLQQIFQIFRENSYETKKGRGPFSLF